MNQDNADSSTWSEVKEVKDPPFGICTDVIGHILVSEFISDSVHILDQNGKYLSKLLTPQELDCPISLLGDDENEIHVGQCNTNKVTVYKYLQ